MAVYVDDYRQRATVRNLTATWSHLLADNEDELIAFGQKLGMLPAWLQDRGTVRAHFDVTDSKRRLAIRLGAHPITYRQAGELINARRQALLALEDAARRETALAATAPPAGPPPPATPSPAGRTRRYNPRTQQHSWRDGELPHWKHCVWCEIAVENRPDPHGPRWFREWHWPNEPARPGGDTYSGAKVPPCPGPPEKPAPPPPPVPAGAVTGVPVPLFDEPSGETP